VAVTKFYIFVTTSGNFKHVSQGLRLHWISGRWLPKLLSVG